MAATAVADVMVWKPEDCAIGVSESRVGLDISVGKVVINVIAFYRRRYG